MRRKPFSIIVLLTLLASCIGCQQKQWADASWTQADYRGASLVFDSSTQQAIAVERPEGVLPWYAARRDRQPGVVSGYEYHSVQHATRVVRDHDHLSHNRPFVSHFERTHIVEHGHRRR